MSWFSRLRKTSNSSVQGKGFTVSIPGIHEIIYREKGLTYKVEIEGGAKYWLVYGDSLTITEPPHTLDTFSRSEMRRILTNISESMKLLGMKHEIDGSWNID